MAWCWCSYYNKERPEKSISEARKISAKIFGEGWDAKGSKVYEEGNRKKVDIWGIGHCKLRSYSDICQNSIPFNSFGPFC